MYVGNNCWRKERYKFLCHIIFLNLSDFRTGVFIKIDSVNHCEFKKKSFQCKQIKKKLKYLILNR